jgi:hypothetical protein
MDMNTQVLRSIKGGYNKLAVITKLDSYNCLIMALEQRSISRNQAINELEKIRNMALPTEKGGFFGKIGFSVEDTDSYMQNCEQMILDTLNNLI